MGSQDNLKSPPTLFISSGLDSKQNSGVNFYGDNDDNLNGNVETPRTNKLGGNQSIQYHMLDPGSNTNMTLNKSSIHKYQYADDNCDDQTNTTNTSESDETTMTKSNRPRFQRHSPNRNNLDNSSNKTTLTTSYTDTVPSSHHHQLGTESGGGTLEKQFIQARLIKSSSQQQQANSSPSPKQSTPNLDEHQNQNSGRFGRAKNFVPFTSSYDKLMNTTLTTDTDDDQDANSKRLLTHKVI